jgi:hypothetical protein
MWIVSPLITPWRGDSRRNGAPYVITAGLGMASYNLACFAKRELERRGIACYVTAI